MVAFSNAIYAPWNLKFSVQAKISSPNLCKICDAIENGKHGNSKLAALKDRPVSLPRPLTPLAAVIFAFASRGKANAASSAKLAIKINRNPSAKWHNCTIYGRASKTKASRLNFKI